MRSAACVILLATIGCRSAEVEAERSHGDTQPENAASAVEPPATEVPAEPSARQLDWSVPACPLTYHYRARLSAGSADINIDFDLVMTARDGGGVSLHAGEIKVSQTLDGKPFGEGMVEGEGAFADVHLELGDGIWTEVDGTTQLWSANQSAPSLMFMWPALPTERTQGATASWTVAGNHDNPEVARTEAARGSLKTPDSWEPPDYEQPPAATNTVTLEAWESGGAADKAILVMDERHSGPSPDDRGQIDVRQVGRYEVLASGRLVRAEVTIELGASNAKATQWAELSLTNDCND